ncbi:50S ribosomal protein L19 [Candidatus Nomurabacteria bacterium RIFCSPLOWO2_01_FULL_40_18]|uniref:Large ribosomal subunit protein bL19 n=1 Tax=Candidatus Nomurabacteria bacterium RIFCSPLOWO2_01_FULL_40_18 TaxID=1801773 RepID=A0A1F6XLG6_9BACT|nr:MAG: 50S ribosomal protein L19 [Candidatus Nomurabacteria bacterium RIFCSPLOWO2_01_FULL_40_18]
MILKIFYAKVLSMKTSNIQFSPVDMASRKGLVFKAGDTVNVWSKILEEKMDKNQKKGEKKKGAAKAGEAPKFRLQAFEGIVLARKHGTEMGATFTVRKIASGVGVERIFPLYSPMLDKIEVTKKSRARRSKLYYIRDKAVKDVRSKMRSITNQIEAEEAVTETPAEETSKVAE